VLFFAVLAIGATAINWYARHTFYVGLQNDQVVIFRGRPGGLLWFDPTLEKRTDLSVDDVLEVHLPELRDGKSQSSLADADRYVNNLEQEAKEARTRPASRPPTTTTSTTATTPLP
jgi:PPM family protein phosphatase